MCIRDRPGIGTRCRRGWAKRRTGSIWRWRPCPMVRTGRWSARHGCNTCRMSRTNTARTSCARRWTRGSLRPVSYTHLDVYKRQALQSWQEFVRGGVFPGLSGVFGALPRKIGASCQPSFAPTTCQHVSSVAKVKTDETCRIQASVSRWRLVQSYGRIK